MILSYVQITISSVILRKLIVKIISFNHLFPVSFFSVKLFVRGSGARYEGSRSIDSLETFYQEKIAEDANV